MFSLGKQIKGAQDGVWETKDQLISNIAHMLAGRYCTRHKLYTDTESR